MKVTTIKSVCLGIVIFCTMCGLISFFPLSFSCFGIIDPPIDIFGVIFVSVILLIFGSYLATMMVIVGNIKILIDNYQNKHIVKTVAIMFIVTNCIEFTSCLCLLLGLNEYFEKLLEIEYVLNMLGIPFLFVLAIRIIIAKSLLHISMVRD